MKKYSWIVALLLALSFTAFFTGCGVDPVEGGGVPFETTDIAGKIQPWGTYKPEIEGNEITIEGNGTTDGSSGFYIMYADIGYDFSRNDSLIFSYEIDVTEPYAALMVKDASTNSWGAPSGLGGAGYGVGKGWEYYLGDATQSNYNGPLVSGKFNAGTGKGTFEVKLALFSNDMKGIGFQHNSYSAAGSLDTKYTLTITKIENKIGGPAQAEFDYDAFNKAVSIPYASLKNEWSNTGSMVVSVDGTIYRNPGSSSLFSIKAPKFTEALKTSEPADQLVISYNAIKSVKTVDLNTKGKGPEDYPTLEGDGRPHELAYKIGSADGAGYATLTSEEETTGIAFQDNSDDDAVWKLKITNVEIRRQGRKAVTIKDIKLTAPVAGKVPAKEIIETAQYTGTIVWAGTLAVRNVRGRNADGTKFAYESVFDNNVAYTPTITLKAKDGYIFNSDVINEVAANTFFTINGSGTGVTYTAPGTTAGSSSLTFTVTGPAVTTGTVSPLTVTSKAITGLNLTANLKPQALAADGNTGIFNIAGDSTQFKANSIAWFKADDDAAVAADAYFDADTEYYATLELGALFPYTLTGATGFTVKGATVTVDTAGDLDKITLKVLFKTEKTVTNAITTLKTTGTPVRSVSNSQYTGTVRWFRASDERELVTGNFEGVAYKARLVLTPKAGWTIKGVDNSFVSGANAVNAGDPSASGTFTVDVTF